MELLTPQFLLQALVTIAAVSAGYGMLRADLKNLVRSLDEERRLREEHSKADDASFHDIRDQLQIQFGAIKVLEAKDSLGQQIADAIRARS